MNISQQGKEFITRLEGGMFRNSYIDSGGEPTIGVGHLLTHTERMSGKIWIAGHNCDYADGLTEEQCYRLLERDLEIAMRAVNRNVIAPLTQNQFDALVSFTFNVGSAAFIDSTLLKLLNKGDYDAVPHQMRRWVYDNGQVVQGLINRRNQEIDYWNGPVTVTV